MLLELGIFSAEDVYFLRLGVTAQCCTSETILTPEVETRQPSSVSGFY